MIDVGLCYFETNPKTIKRCLDSFYEYVDHIFCIDGKFTEFEYPENYSPKEVRDLIDSYPNTIIKYCASDEVTKRTEYLKLCEQYKTEYLLIIDGDEWVLEADWDLFKSNLTKVGNREPYQPYLGMKFLIDKNGGFGAYPKIWHWPQNIEYLTHGIFRNKTNNVISRSSSATAMEYLVDGLMLMGGDDLRDPDYCKRSYEYQLKLIAKEKPLKKQILGR